MTKQTARSRLMAKIRARDTQPEQRFRRAIWRRGLRFRVCDTKLPGKPDLVLPAPRLLVFIDGDFWHGHQWRLRGLSCLADQFQNSPSSDYWMRKIARNNQRDFRVTDQNLQAGWSVLRFWESDIKHRLDECVNMTMEAVQPAATPTSATPSSAALLPGRQVAEFFAGIGLVRLALENQGWGVAFANDNDPQKASMYQSNFGVGHLSTADIRDLSAADVPDCALYTASFPCNDLSVAGGRVGLNGDHSGMFWEFLRIVREKAANKPPLILLENVAGFLRSHQGRDFETALRALNELGYCVDAFLLNAAHFAPQSRVRLFVVGKLCPANSPEVPLVSELRPKPLVEFMRAHRDLRWDIRALPDPPAPRLRLPDILEDLEANDPLWWDEPRSAYFMGQLSERHLATAQEMIAGRQYRYGTAFRRVRQGRSMAELRTDGIAGCLRTPRGGSGRQILFKAGHGRYFVRLLSPRECARLQGVPDDYKIEVALNQALFGFGDAVCVPAVAWIAEHYLTPEASEVMRGRVLKRSGG